MRIDDETVRNLADLAKLELSDGEAENMLRDLDQILTYVEQLNALDTADVPPTTHALELTSPLRPDRVVDVLSADEAVRNAPQRSATAMVVPQVLDE